MRGFTWSAMCVAAGVLAAGPAAAQDVATSRVLAVEWPAGYDGAAAPNPDSRLDAVNATLLPVLIPQSFLKFATFDFVGDPLHYTASVLAAGAKLSITGTRVAVDAPTDAGPGTAATDAIITEMGEGSVQATRTRYGAAYLVTVECARKSDRRCATDRYARALLEGAIFVGGGKGTPPESDGASAPLPPATPLDPRFRPEDARPAGQLVSGSGTGVTSTTVYGPGIRFPVEKGPAYLNSQVWGIGGTFGPPGGWSDRKNYAYPWRDNFCESRARSTPACPSGKGHQGVDIRPADHRDLVHWAVASEGGRITNVGVYSVTLVGESGTQYRYLHLEMARLAVRQGQSVQRGQRIGLVSQDFGGTPTPVHLHFEMLQNVAGRGFRHVPPYSSLVRAYQQGN